MGHLARSVPIARVRRPIETEPDGTVAAAASRPTVCPSTHTTHSGQKDTQVL
jgi:hypothetical protein